MQRSDFDPERMASDPTLVKTDLAITRHDTDRFLDRAIQMKAIKFAG